MLSVGKLTFTDPLLIQGIELKSARQKADRECMGTGCGSRFNLSRVDNR